MRNISIFSLFLLFISCAESDEPATCVASFDSEICLIIEEGAVSTDAMEWIIDEISRGIIRIQQAMPVSRLDIRIVDKPSLVIPGQAAGGYNPSAREIELAIRRNVSEEEIRNDFMAVLAHEIHHAKRRRSVGYGETLLEALITEGLADHFALEITGSDPYPWSVSLSESELSEWIAKSRENWHDPYNHNVWFFGADGSVPYWAGYSIGFHLVKEYLVNHPHLKASMLHDVPATILVK